jgi:hypothetical protein
VQHLQHGRGRLVAAREGVERFGHGDREGAAGALERRA